MKICVMGYNHLSGVSKKTNKEYDFYILDVLSRRVEGHGASLAASSVSVQATAFNNMLSDLVNEKAVYPLLLDVEYDSKGNIVEAGRSGTIAADWLSDYII